MYIRKGILNFIRFQSCIIKSSQQVIPIHIAINLLEREVAWVEVIITCESIYNLHVIFTCYLDLLFVEAQQNGFMSCRAVITKVASCTLLTVTSLIEIFLCDRLKCCMSVPTNWYHHFTCIIIYSFSIGHSYFTHYTLSLIRHCTHIWYRVILWWPKST